jgi:hypothetical protein
MTDDLIERLRINTPYEAPRCLEAADRIEAQAAEIERLREALREVFEHWAGSEGFIPETAPEGYLLQLTKRMANAAADALAGKAEQ